MDLRCFASSFAWGNVQKPLKSVVIQDSLAMPPPIISVVASCYNKSKTISDCVTSILHQNTGQIETIVVDDDSTDGSTEILSSLKTSDALTILKEEHSGISSTKNKGFAASNGEIVLFIDGDCILEDGSLIELAKSFEGTKIGCVGGEVRATNTESQIAQAVELMQNELDRKWPFGANVAYSKKTLEEAGLFDERMTAGEDADLYLRVMKFGFKSVINKKIIARTKNPDNVVDFFRQRLNWGRGFRQLTERHPETSTRKIRICLLWMSIMLFSPLLALIDVRLGWMFPVLVMWNLLRFSPGAITLYRRTRDVKHCAIVPFLRFINALAYLLGWSHWLFLEFTGKVTRLDPFISSAIASSVENDSPV